MYIPKDISVAVFIVKLVSNYALKITQNMQSTKGIINVSDFGLKISN